MSSRKIDPSHFAPDIREFLLTLVKHGVEFLIVGGEAVIFHGYSRVTGDIDIFYATTGDNVLRLFAALKEFWGGVVPGVRSASSLSEGVIVQFGVPPNRVDLINRIDGIAFQEAWDDRVTVELECAPSACRVNFIGLRALVRNKEASGRQKDLDDLRYLRAARREQRTRRRGA